MGEFNFETLSLCEMKTATLPVAVNTRFSLKEDVASVLALDCTAIVTDSQSGESDVSAKGRAQFTLLYANSANELKSASFFAEFSDKILADNLNGAKAAVECVVADSGWTLTANVVAVHALIELTATYALSSTCEAFSGGEHVFLQTADKEICVSATTRETQLDVIREWTTKSAVREVLGAEGFASVTGTAYADGVLTVSGNVYLYLTYTDGDGKTLAEIFASPFSEETPSETNCFLTVSPCVRAVKLRVENGEEHLLGADMTISLVVKQMCQTVAKIACDAYSTEEELTTETKDCICTSPCGCVTANVKTEQIISADVENFECAVFPRVTVTKVTAGFQTVTVEGVVSAWAIYNSEQRHSAALEMPFSETVAVDFAREDCIPTATACVSALDVAATPSGFSVHAELSVSVCGNKNEKIRVITSCQGEPLDKNEDAAIEICMAQKGETVWALGKSLHISPDEIMSVNPDLSSPLEKDTRIVLYHKL